MTNLIIQSGTNIAESMVNFNTSLIDINNKLTDIKNLPATKQGKKYSKLNNKLFEAVNKFTATLETDAQIIDSETRSAVNAIAFQAGMLANNSDENKPSQLDINELIEKLKIAQTTGEILGGEINKIAISFASYEKKEWLNKATAKMAKSADLLVKMANFIAETIIDLQNIDKDDDAE